MFKLLKFEIKNSPKKVLKKREKNSHYMIMQYIMSTRSEFTAIYQRYHLAVLILDIYRILKLDLTQCAKKLSSMLALLFVVAERVNPKSDFRVLT